MLQEYSLLMEEVFTIQTFASIFGLGCYNIQEY
jgi:hypothetical protein